MNNIFDFGVSKDTPDTIWILDIPLKKEDKEKLLKRGYSDDEASEILLDLVAKTKWVYKQAIMKVPKDLREDTEFRRGLFQGLYKGLSFKVDLSTRFRNSVRKIKSKLNTIFLRERRSMIDNAVNMALSDKKKLYDVVNKHLKNEGK